VTALSALCCVTHWAVEIQLQPITHWAVEIQPSSHGNVLLCPRLVRRICQEGAVANVDCKLSRSSLDDHTVSRKVETSSSEAKIVRMNDLPVTGYPCYAQRTLESPWGKHCKSLEGNV